jgi:hypothetical protein
LAPSIGGFGQADIGKLGYPLELKPKNLLRDTAVVAEFEVVDHGLDVLKCSASQATQRLGVLLDRGA